MLKKIKKISLSLISISLLFQVSATAATVDLDRLDSNWGEAVISRDRGYYMDGRGQVPEYSRIAPPHEENIPTPHATKTVVGWDRYYAINKEGYRPMGYQMPLVPNYNIHYSNRRANPYSRAEFVKVWCDGEADLKRGICTTSDYNFYFYKVRDWAFAVAGAPIRNLKNGKNGRRSAIVFAVDELGLDAESMHAAKEWAELYDMKIHFVTIDAYIPLDWVL